MFKESKKRSLYKTISWRLVAIINSWVTLSVVDIESNLWMALFMNFTGLILFYIYERVWNNVNYGKEIV